MKFIIGSRGSGVTTDILLYKMAELTEEQADVIIKSAQYISETTVLTFQEALDKEIEKLQKELK